MTIDQARKDFQLVSNTLLSERGNRSRFLSEPRKSQAVKEIDDAVAVLRRLGQIVQAAKQAGLIETVYEQAPLLDLPKQSTY